LYRKDIITAENYKIFYLSTLEILDEYTIFLNGLSQKFTKEKEVVKKKSKEERINFISKTGSVRTVRISTPVGKQFFDNNISVDRIFRILQYCFRYEIIEFNVYLETVSLNKKYFKRFDEGLFKIGKFVKKNYDRY
jgi:hypothetical protein